MPSTDTVTDTSVIWAAFKGNPLSPLHPAEQMQNYPILTYFPRARLGHPNHR